jgi:acyl-CoA thioesterase I
MVRFSALVLAFWMTLLGGPRAETLLPLPQICDAPADFVEPEEPMPHLQAALASRAPVNILAIGSGTTVGEVNATPGASFPYRMVDALRTADPATTFDLTVKGGRNMTAEGMLGLLKEELPKRHYALVLWQTGTVEAVRGMRPDMMRDVLQEGIDLIQAADGDVVLVDPQFSRFLRANADLDPYESVMQEVATLPGVVLFHRFELMRNWASDGHIDLERVQKSDRENAVAQLNTCLGATLARFVLAGATQTTN